MNLINVDTIPGIQNLDDSTAEKHNGGYCLPNSSASTDGNIPDLSLSTDEGISVQITVIAPPGGAEVNFGDINLNAGGDINFDITEVQTADATA